MQSRTSRYFAAIAQHNSLRDAADTLHVAQSALSRQISKIEEEFGAPMLERHPRGVMLTPAGEIYLRYARDQLAEEDHMRAELDALKGLHHGTLRIHAIESLARSMLPPLLAVFREAHRGVKFNIMISGSDEIIGAVREVATDIGLSYYSQPSPEIEIRALLREPLVAVVAANHPLAKRKQISLRDAAEFPAALTSKNSRSRNLIDTACWQAGVSLSPVMETNSIELLSGFVEHSNGVTFLLRIAALEGIRARRLAAVPIHSEILNLGVIEALTRASRKLAPIGEEFLAFLGAQLQTLQEQNSHRRRK
jgi:DNA-binding transcriptional LysR family regulator